MIMQTIVSAFLFGIGKASGHPVKWSTMVRIYWFPDLETFWSVTKSMAILPKGQSCLSIICDGYICIFWIFLLAKGTMSNVFLDVLVHSIPVILSSDEVTSHVDSLVT